MHGLDLQLSTPDKEDLHGLPPERGSFVPLSSATDDFAAVDIEVRSTGKTGQHRQRALPTQVRIDEDGLFKYVLLEYTDGDPADQPSESFQEHSSLLIRGSARFTFHKQNVVEAQKELQAFGLPPCVHISNHYCACCVACCSRTISV